MANYLKETITEFLHREVATLEKRVELLRSGKLRTWSQTLDGPKVETTQDDLFQAETKVAENRVHLKRLEADNA